MVKKYHFILTIVFIAIIFFFTHDVKAQQNTINGRNFHKKNGKWFQIENNKKYEVDTCVITVKYKPGVSLSDINNDGVPEIIIGERGESNLQQVIGNGNVYMYSFGKINGIEKNEAEIFPEEYKLFPAYPTPFNPTTTITYQLYKRLDISLEVYSITGEKIKTLLKQNQAAGNYSVKWNGDNEEGFQMTSGIYLIKLIVGKEKENFRQKIIKTVLLK